MIPKKVIQAQNVMKPIFIEMDGLNTVQEALERLRNEEAKVVIVKKRHEHDAHGLILLSDIAKKVLAKDRAPERVNLYEIMAKPMLTVPPEMDVRYCARLFDRFGLSVAPVLKDDEIIGIVSYSELVLHGLCELVE
ncbi:MAG: CBS domain-containing protein [Pseudomonadales bacterium]|nr:CBS domain-containing protein [Pseudomonadales bacterium]